MSNCIQVTIKGTSQTWTSRLALAPDPALVQELPVHFWYSEMVPEPPQNSDAAPAHCIWQFPTTPGTGAPLAGIELPPLCLSVWLTQWNGA